ncbi:MAG: sulfurtransferase TusA family protein [Sulfuricella sp.]
MNIDKELDARGLNCPLPILRTKKALAEIGAGQILKITATDSGAEASGEFVFFLRKH